MVDLCILGENLFQEQVIVHDHIQTVVEVALGSILDEVPLGVVDQTHDVDLLVS